MAQNMVSFDRPTSISMLASLLGTSNQAVAYQFYMAVIAQEKSATLWSICNAVQNLRHLKPTPALVIEYLHSPSRFYQRELVGNQSRPGISPRVIWNSDTPVNALNGNNKHSFLTWSSSADNHYAFLIVVEDAFEHTPIASGEKIAYCSLDKVAYHWYTWLFLKAQNNNRCCICGKTGTIQEIQLPQSGSEIPVEMEIRPGGQNIEKVIGLADVHHHVGLAVVVQDTVQEVYETKSTGTFYIRFEKRGPADPPFQGFKVVIRPRYAKDWANAGLSPKLYEHKIVRVRGIIHKDPEWGIEILINSPRVIQIVTGAGIL